MGFGDGYDVVVLLGSRCARQGRLLGLVAACCLHGVRGSAWQCSGSWCRKSSSQEGNVCGFLVKPMGKDGCGACGTTSCSGGLL